MSLTIGTMYVHISFCILNLSIHPCETLNRIEKPFQAIHGYRESERTEWNTENKKILDRVKQFAFDSFQNQALKDEPSHSSILSHVHILDLHKDGFIKPHVSSFDHLKKKVSLCQMLGFHIIDSRLMQYAFVEM